MATGVQPRDVESNLTRADLEAIHDAMKCKKFRELLNEYCEEVRDPANQAIYQKEMVQLEKERGYDVKFINPKGGYVIKTSVAGDRKAFINICSNENMDKPTCKVQEVNGQKGMNWQLPYSIIPPREDIDHKKQRCVIYDVVFHPDTLRMAEANKRFRELVNKTAFEGLQKTYDIHLDINNCRFPKSYYKGMTIPAVIRKEDPNYLPPDIEENCNMSPELVEKLYPQQVYAEEEKPIDEKIGSRHKQHKKKLNNNINEYMHSSDNGYSIPKYVIKQQKNVDLQDYTYHKDSKQYSTIPSHLVVEINLPLLSSTKGCTLDVREKKLNLISEKPAKYKLDLTLPYAVNDECGSAKFDKTKHMLIVTLPVKKQTNNNDKQIIIRSDSGIDSENNSLDEEEPTKALIEELNLDTYETCAKPMNNDVKTKNNFFETSVGYTLPPYTFNVLDNIIAFTFHVKNTEPNSVFVKEDNNRICIKFSTMGSGFVTIHYAAVISFTEDIGFENINGEAWDNNVILQLELKDSIPHNFLIGLNDTNMKYEHFDFSKVQKNVDCSSLSTIPLQEDNTPLVEVTNLRCETNIIVSCNKNNESDNCNDDIWAESNHSVSAAKSILRKPLSMMRSFSESSTCDVASSIDYISSDCIPEESSFKKTVRFNDVIARQFYRYNSSIEGQKRKNQRKKSKKRSQERRKSESEAEEDISTSIQKYKPRLKSVLKQRHDSGLADTSDAENEFKTTMSDSDVPYDKVKYLKKEDDITKKVKSMLNIEDNTENIIDEDHKPVLWTKLDKSFPEKMKKLDKKETITCDSIKHNTDLYNPDKLNKGQYLEVTFKNDLIFDLDM